MSIELSHGFELTYLKLFSISSRICYEVWRVYEIEREFNYLLWEGIYRPQRDLSLGIALASSQFLI